MAETIGAQLSQPTEMGVAPALALILDPDGNGKAFWQDSKDALQLAEQALNLVMSALPGAGPVFTLFQFVQNALPSIQPLIDAETK